MLTCFEPLCKHTHERNSGVAKVSIDGDVKAGRVISLSTEDPLDLFALT